MNPPPSSPRSAPSPGEPAPAALQRLPRLPQLLDPTRATPPLFREGDAWRLPLLLLVTLVVFWPILRAGFVYDDLLMVEQNPSIRSLGSIPSLFTSSYWDFLGPREALRIGYWRPLTATSLTLAHAVGGDAPFAYHLLSLLVHLAATAVSFRLLQRLTRSTPAAFWGALLFGVHPLHVESVAWISALNDPLFGLFGLLALNSFCAWRDGGSRGMPWAAALWFLLGLLSKELAAAVVPLAFLIDLGRARSMDDGGSAGSDLRERLRPFLRAWLPFAVVLLAVWAWRVYVFGDWGAGFDRQTTDFGVSAGRLAVLRLELVAGGTWLLFWPSALSLFHAFQPEFAAGDPTPWIAAGITGLLFAGAAWAWVQRSGLVFLALLVIPAAVSPALVRAASLGMFPLSERFLYLSVLSVALLVPLLGQRLARTSRALALTLLVLVTGAAAWRTTERLPDWQDEESLWRASALETPDSPYVQWGLGRVLLGAYQRDGDPAQLEAAYTAFKRSQDLAQAGRHGDGRIFTTAMDSLQSNLGVGWCELSITELEGHGDFSTPIEVFRQIAEAFPTSEDAFTGLGSARLRGGELDGAIEAFREALRLAPKSVPAHSNLGRAYFQAGELDMARRHLEFALELKPSHVGARLALAQVEYTDGNLPRARELADEVRESYPDDPEAATLLGSMAASRRDWQGALEWLDRALAGSPDYGPAHLAKGKVLIALGESDEAIASFRRATQAMPASFEAHYNLGALLEANGAGDAAVPYLERAYDVGTNAGLLTRVRGALLQLSPNDLRLALRLAQLDLARGDLPSAALWAEHGLQLAPRSAEALLVRARVHEVADETEAAVAAYREAVELGASSFGLHRDLGLLLARLGRTNEAITELERAREIGPPEQLGEELQELALLGVEQRLAELRDQQGPVAPR